MTDKEYYSHLRTLAIVLKDQSKEELDQFFNQIKNIPEEELVTLDWYKHLKNKLEFFNSSELKTVYISDISFNIGIKRSTNL